MAMIHALEAIDKKQVPGAVVECGVWRGGNIILARRVCPDRACWLYDTFHGMTKPSKFDVKRDGKSAIASYERKRTRGDRWAEASRWQVIENFMALDLWDADRMFLIEGDVEQTLRDANNLPDQIALLRLDTDWYASTRIELEILYPRLERGGILIVDDYGHWLGARKAVNDYFRKSPIALQPIDYTAVMAVKA
jgi:hypothetical protein